MYKLVKNFNLILQNEEIAKALKILYVMIFLAIIGFQVKWCAFVFSLYIFILSLNLKIPIKIKSSKGDKRFEEILKMKEIPLQDE